MAVMCDHKCNKVWTWFQTSGQYLTHTARCPRSIPLPSPSPPLTRSEGLSRPCGCGQDDVQGQRGGGRWLSLRLCLQPLGPSSPRLGCGRLLGNLRLREGGERR